MIHKDMNIEIAKKIEEIQIHLDDIDYHWYEPVNHVNTDIEAWSMLTSEDWTKFMYTFYMNHNYDEDVVITKTRIDFSVEDLRL